MEQSAFETQADRTLRDLMARLERALGGDADVDLCGGILTVALDDGRQFVVNRHAPNRELWLSSPVSGATHFAAGEGGWRATRGGGSLTDTLASDLGRAIGRPVTLGD